MEFKQCPFCVRISNLVFVRQSFDIMCHFLLIAKGTVMIYDVVLTARGVLHV